MTKRMAARAQLVTCWQRGASRAERAFSDTLLLARRLTLCIVAQAPIAPYVTPGARVLVGASVCEALLWRTTGSGAGWPAVSYTLRRMSVKSRAGFRRAVEESAALPGGS